MECRLPCSLGPCLAPRSHLPSVQGRDRHLVAVLAHPAPPVDLIEFKAEGRAMLAREVQGRHLVAEILRLAILQHAILFWYRRAWVAQVPVPGCLTYQCRHQLPLLV